MDIISSDEIIFLLSGGASNNNPLLSLGGVSSTIEVIGNINGLFPDVTPAQVISGMIDYRCFYVKNISSLYSLYKTRVYIQSQTGEGSEAILGTKRQDEVQRIRITGVITSGTADFDIGGQAFSGTWTGSADSFKDSLYSSLSSIDFYDVDIEYSLDAGDYFFNITFTDSLGNKSYPLITLVSNNLINAVDVIISKFTHGHPISNTTTTIASPQTFPSGITFEISDVDSPIQIGTLGPGESFPVWIRRTTISGTPPLLLDGAIIRISGNPFGNQ